MSKPIKLYGHAGGPNPWKVAILLEELGVPYETEYMDMAVLHQEPYESINPNGRTPSIHDPNTNITLWESGAIVEYLVQEYDKEGKLHYKTSPEKYQTQQYLHFQVSGQGPYFGQAAWFGNFHPEKLPSAIERYQKEVSRVTKVLDSCLTRAGSGVLVGSKITYADLSFVPWYWMIGIIDKSGALEKELHEQNPHWSKWINSLNERAAVKKAAADRQKAMGK